MTVADTLADQTTPAAQALAVLQQLAADQTPVTIRRSLPGHTRPGVFHGRIASVSGPHLEPVGFAVRFHRDDGSQSFLALAAGEGCWLVRNQEA